nr:stage V sporulation protein K [Fictibacillus macauensis]
MTFKKKTQINIILNQEQEKGVTERIEKAAPVSKSKAAALEKHLPLKKMEQEMATLVGMEELKSFVKEVYAWIYVNKCRESQGLKVEKQVLHMMFKGNPGTGKTTVARLLGRLFHEMNVLSKGHLIEVERADLVGEYIGHTAQKTRDLLKKAMGGILFIDEAYSLARGGEKDFGKEAIDTLVKAMEDQQHDFILILAGYSKEMEKFLELNPGLPSRFPTIVTFPDYSVEELMEIARRMIAERQYLLSKDLEWRLKQHLQKVCSNGEKGFSNGRYIRNIIEKTVRKQSVRLLKEEKTDKKSLMTLTADDLHLEEKLGI